MPKRSNISATSALRNGVAAQPSTTGVSAANRGGSNLNAVPGGAADACDRTWRTVAEASGIRAVHADIGVDQSSVPRSTHCASRIAANDSLRSAMGYGVSGSAGWTFSTSRRPNPCSHTGWPFSTMMAESPGMPAWSRNASR